MNLQVWKTSRGQMDFAPCNKISNQQCNNKKELIVNSEVEYQEVIGFGGAFNEVGWEAISKLDENKKSEVLNSLFSEGECNFNFCRTPIGASDFALDAYSLNDNEYDFEMKEFSIERDKKYLIPYLKEALKTREGLRLWASPWSPPYWMKTNKSMCKGGELIDTPEYLRAYAKYLSRYIDEYNSEGIKIEGFCIQNETDVINVYPTSTMTPEVMSKFIRAYLIPEIMDDQRKLKSEIWAGTIRILPGYADVIMSEAVNREFVTGIGYQYSSEEVVADGYTKFRNKKIIHTETPCHNGANSWEEAEETFKDMLMYLKNGCENYCYWNMVLNETGLSTWNWKQNSMITVNRETNDVIYNPEYYVMKHFSKLVQSGARRIDSKGLEKDSHVAFRNPDGSIICVLSNFEDEESIVNIKFNGENIEKTLEPHSIYTIKLS